MRLAKMPSNAVNGLGSLRFVRRRRTLTEPFADLSYDAFRGIPLPRTPQVAHGPRDIVAEIASRRALHDARFAPGLRAPACELPSVGRHSHGRRVANKDERCQSSRSFWITACPSEP